MRRVPPATANESWKQVSSPQVRSFGPRSRPLAVLAQPARVVSKPPGIYLYVNRWNVTIGRHSWPENLLMPYLPIEDYGIIGNMRTVALVGINGSIDWYCSPNFDSPSIFGAILDDNKGGRFQIAPVADRVRGKQFYWPSTNILVTRFSHEDGISDLEDFMPVDFPSDSPSYHQIHRRVRCVRGPARLRVACHPAFDYGRQLHEVRIDDR